MKIKTLVLAIALVLCGSAAFAQETNRDENGKFQYGPYETNLFLDNWFIGAGAGLNWGMNGVYQKIFKGHPECYSDGLGLNINAYIGKWVEPCWGFRIGWAGLKGTDLSNKDRKFPGDLYYNYFHVDGLVNLSNLFAGYKETRTVDFVFYPHVGFLNNFFEDFKMAGGLGLMIPIRINNFIHIVPDFRYDILPAGSAVIMRQSCACGTLAATIGIQFNLHRDNWSRKSTTVGGFASALGASEALRLAAQAKADELMLSGDAANKANAELSAENKNLQDEIIRLQAMTGGNLDIDLAENPIRVFFDLNKTTLSKQELSHLDFYVKTILSKKKDAKLVINGEADSKTGSSKVNQKLSEKRAQYLYDILTKKYGIPADQFEINPCGGIEKYNPYELNRAGEISTK